MAVITRRAFISSVFVLTKKKRIYYINEIQDSNVRVYAIATDLFLTSKLRIGRWKFGTTAAFGETHLELLLTL